MITHNGKGTDPILDEDYIGQLLDIEKATQFTCPRLQAGAVMAIVDAFDRKATRENFMVIVAAAIGLHTEAGKLALMASVQEAYRNGCCDDKAIQDAMDGLEKLAQHQLTDCKMLAKKLAECPTTNDLVH